MAAASAQQINPTLDDCVRANNSLDEQIWACQDFLETGAATTTQVAYLAPIIATLRGEVGDFARAVEIDDEAGLELLLTMGEAQVQAERYGRAIAFFQAAETHFEDSKDAVLRRYSFLDQLRQKFADQPQKLLSIVEIGLRYEVDDPALNDLQALNYVRLNNAEMAIMHLDIAVDAVEYPQAQQIRRAQAYRLLERPEDALADVLDVFAYLHPNSHYVHGIEHTLPHGSDFAVSRYLEMVNDIPPVWEQAFNMLVEIAWELDKPDVVLAATATWLEQRPDSVFGLLERAKALAVFDRDAEARTLLDMALEHAFEADGGIVGGRSRIVLWARGRLSIKQKDTDLAMADFDAFFVSMNDDRAEDIEKLQHLLTNLGAFDGEISGVFDQETRGALRHCIEMRMCNGL
ncbi:hypothetical protein [Yoonia sp. BS5-3]|uniref:Tetratricopeptide repeat protein n=1 Tax=Yoonia phaeophyticola TaxID=3137369 RepID=A0ABZ2V1V0_9RHOB